MASDRPPTGQKESRSLPAAVAILLLLLSGVLLAQNYLQRLIEEAIPRVALVPHSVDAVLAIVVVAWWYFAACLAVRLVRRVSPRFLFPFDAQPRLAMFIAPATARSTDASILRSETVEKLHVQLPGLPFQVASIRTL
jgi:hypothetical protein